MKVKTGRENDFHMLLFPGDALVLAESEMPDESFLVVICLLMILGCPISEEMMCKE